MNIRIKKLGLKFILKFPAQFRIQSIALKTIIIESKKKYDIYLFYCDNNFLCVYILLKKNKKSFCGFISCFANENNQFQILFLEYSENQKTL